MLAALDVGPIQAVKESAAFSPKTWARTSSASGLGLATGFILFGMILVGGVLVISAAMTQNVYRIVTVLALDSRDRHRALAGALSVYAAALIACERRESGGFDASTIARLRAESSRSPTCRNRRPSNWVTAQEPDSELRHHGLNSLPFEGGSDMSRAPNLRAIAGSIAVSVAAGTCMADEKTAEADRQAVARLDIQYQSAVERNDADTMALIHTENMILVLSNGTVVTGKAKAGGARSRESLHFQAASSRGRFARGQGLGRTAVITAKLWLKGTRPNGEAFGYKLWFSEHVCAHADRLCPASSGERERRCRK